ncbi:hypothetical protein PGT21_016073 [Puccinia graminis f. sp. tritici]|uniref:Uncharacterized protein n=2 Tax=Puccinia graminis f. sp. tritici TaxID=56615 RepID=A0A5B0PXQ4_PUCGR|nr:hypothetical protein PGT21_016073 [Puccinia graminis f. sp. tritici]
MGEERTSRMHENSLDETDVVIIGAGASGLAAIKQLTTTTELDVVCFEARSGPGGVWSPENKSEKKEMRVEFDRMGRPFVRPSAPMDCSPIYDGLRTNVPKHLMAFHDQPFNVSTAEPESEFPPAGDVSRYLLQTARRVEHRIRFNSLVTRVRHRPPPDPSQPLQNAPATYKERRWIVEVVEPPSSINPHPQEFKSISCDFVLAASGHYSVPYVPFIPSLWTWPKEIIHSCVYTNPRASIFHQKTVAVIGIGPSGYDILRELAMVREAEAGGGGQGGRKIKLYSVASHPAKLGWDFADPEAPGWTKQITSVPRFARIEGHKIWLVDGRLLEDIDLLCFATGYLYHFPFCWPLDQPWNTHPLTHPPPIPEPPPPPPPSFVQEPSNLPFPGAVRVHHLDQTQLFYYPDPSFGFLVLQTQVVPFPLAEYQARAIAARWSGRSPFAIVPMTDNETESKTVHGLSAPKEFEYEDELLERIGEGGEEGDNESHWGRVPAWKYKAREETAAKRRLELGY